MNGLIFFGTTALRETQFQWQRLRRQMMILGLGFLLAITASLHAEDFTLNDGTVYKNVTVTKVDPDGLRIIHSDGGGKVLFTQLPESIQKKYNYDPVAAQKYTDEQDAKRHAKLEMVLQQAAAESSTATAAPAIAPAPVKKPVVKFLPDTIYPLVKGKLDYFDGTSLHNFDETKLSNVRYYAVYYSAIWCGPCRAFTPDLVAFYNKFKPNHSNFELIFVSLDENEAGLIQYMKTDAMPWPAVRFSSIEHTSNGRLTRDGIQKFVGHGIPDLVLIDAATGSVMSDSFDGENYLGPQKVLADIGNMVK